MTADELLQQLKNVQNDLATEPYDPVTVKHFNNLFNLLDGMLRSGAQFPRAWVTHENQKATKY